MRDRLRAALPLLLGAATVLLFFSPLLRPSAVLAVRDLPRFHLPLRTALAAAARDGLPLWNPMIHGGQPILSNPNYAAFYPPTWLVLLAPPHFAISLTLLLHAGLAFAGAWRLARHLGCRPAAAAFAAFAFTGGGAFVSSASSLTPYCGLAWMPWVMLAGDRALRGRGSVWLPAAGLALQILAGEPVIVLTTGLALACLALDGGRRLPRRLAALGVAAALTLLLSAVQVLPTALRVLDSPRAAGLEASRQTTWSTPPARLVEWLFPRFFGDPARAEENLYLGWGIHDRNFPYLISIYPGQLTLLLGLAALLLWPVPRRRAWWGMVLLGLFLAIGRFNPLFALLSEALPPLQAIRYPEKFLLLATAALPFAAALGWEHLLARRRAGRPQTAELPLALALVAALLAGVLLAALHLRPDLGVWYVRRHTLLPPAGEELAAAVAYLRGEALAALLVSVASVLVFALHRSPRPREIGLALLALAALGTDLGRYHRGLTATVSSRDLLEPPPLARRLAGADRIFTDQAFSPGGELVPRSSRAGPDALWHEVDQLRPYLGNLWGLSYALHEDYDLLLTGWARRTLDTLHEVWPQPELAQRFLGAWGVSHLVHNRPLAELLRERLRGGDRSPARLRANAAYLPRIRLPPEIVFHPGRETALEAARAEGFPFTRREHWVGPGRPQEVLAAAAAELLETEERSASLRIAYRAAGTAYLVTARTFDRGWRAEVDGEPIALFPTAAGQLGVVLPSGRRTLTLRYRDRSVVLGAAISIGALLLATLAGARGPRASA